MTAAKEKAETRACVSGCVAVYSTSETAMPPRFVSIVAIAIAVASCDRSQPEEATATSEPTARSAESAGQSSARDLTCSDPVRAGDTAASLKSRYGAEAREETLGGAEGSEFPGLALWPDDPSRRLEVFFREDGAPTVSSVRLGEGSHWRVGGLAVGDPLSRVREAHGAPFTFLGFGWDYGGYVGDLAGGRLETLPGGCAPTMRLDALGPIDDSLDASGDVEVGSDTPGLAAANVRLIELGISFPAE